MTVAYTESGDIAFYNDYRFRKDKKSGYYLSSKAIGNKRKRLHVYVWECERGEIPEGHSVHHIDENKANNSIDNLALMTSSDHSRHHSNEKVKTNYDAIVKNLNDKARPKAKEWHASKEGSEWHKFHYERIKQKLYVKHNFECLFCGKEFTSTQTESKFCSNNCKSAYRRKMGFDNIKAKCEICGKEYEKNKYSKTRTCSKECKTKLLIYTRNKIHW